MGIESLGKQRALSVCLRAVVLGLLRVNLVLFSWWLLRHERHSPSRNVTYPRLARDGKTSFHLTQNPKNIDIENIHDININGHDR
jgi:hypothetical protein